MCGRLDLGDLPGIRALLTRLGLAPPDLQPEYNLAPGRRVPVLTSGPALRVMVWGLVAPWAPNDPWKRLINARSESVWEKPSFRALIKAHRCVVLASGFYEWQRQGRAPSQPHHFRRADGRALALAGLYRPGSPGECCLLTMAADTVMAPVHTRMPVILEEADIVDWLQPQQTHQRLVALMRPTAEVTLQARPVSPYVNDVRNQGPGCLDSPQAQQPGLDFG